MYFWLFVTKIGVNEYLGVTDLNHLNCIPEQFTVKAHPALFEGVGEGWAKNEALLFQSTVNIHFQNAHKTQKLRRLALCAFI